VAGVTRYGQDELVDLSYPPSPLTELSIAELRRRRSFKWREYPEDVLPLWVAEMDTPLAPPVHGALSEALALGDTGYVRPGQPNDLAEAFCEFALARFGWVVEPSACVVVPDVMIGVEAALELATERGDGVVVNPPVYHPFFAHIELAGRRVVESPLAWSAEDGYVLDLDRLAADLAPRDVTAYLLCNPHNPTGVVHSRDELVAVAELAERYGVRVLVDEIHAPLVYPGAVHTPFLSLADEADAAARAFVFVSASKAWNLAGLKAALAIAGPEVDVASVPREVTIGAGLLGVIAGDAAFRSGGAWLDSLLVGLDANRMLLGRLLAELLPDVWYRPPSATYLAWLDCRALGAGDPADLFLERGRVAVNSGVPFGAGGEGFVRVNFATAPDILADGVGRMAAALGVSLA
jgi:cystathionine beta-lyase